MSTSFADQIDYDALFAQLASPDTPGGAIVFSEENKKLAREIIDKKFRKYDGNAIMGSSAGASITNWVYMLFAYIQNIFGNEGKFDLSAMGNRLTDLDTPADRGKVNMLEKATIEIYDDFRSRGGEFARAADLISGQSISSSAPRYMAHNLQDQIREQNHLSPTLTAPLNRSERKGNTVG